MWFNTGFQAKTSAPPLFRGLAAPTSKMCLNVLCFQINLYDSSQMSEKPQ